MKSGKAVMFVYAWILFFAAAYAWILSLIPPIVAVFVGGFILLAISSFFAWFSWYSAGDKDHKLIKRGSRNITVIFAIAFVIGLIF